MTVPANMERLQNFYSQTNTQFHGLFSVDKRQRLIVELLAM